jgi:hypothetical protein
LEHREFHLSVLHAEIAKGAGRNPDIFMALIEQSSVHRSTKKATHVAIRDAELATGHPNSYVVDALLHQAYGNGFSIRDETHVAILNAELAKGADRNPDIFIALVRPRQSLTVFRNLRPHNRSIINGAYVAIRDAELAIEKPNPQVLSMLFHPPPPPPDWPLAYETLMKETHSTFLHAQIAKGADRNPDIFRELLNGC